MISSPAQETPSHLKRLSLSTSSPSLSPLGDTTRSPLQRHSPRKLRTSISYSPTTSPTLTRTAHLPRISQAIEESDEQDESSTRQQSDATLVEQHSDLLAQIAEKERTCLDLREELRSREAELSLLKQRWEAIVTMHTKQAPRPYRADLLLRKAGKISTRGSSTERTQNELSLRTPVSNLSGDSFHPYEAQGQFHQQAEVELKEMKAWVGGVLNKFVETVVGPGDEEETPSDANLQPEDSDSHDPANVEPQSIPTNRDSSLKPISTLNILGNAANGGLASLGRRWNAVRDSETFRNSKLAAASFVDAFAETLVSFEPDVPQDETSGKTSDDANLQKGRRNAYVRRDDQNLPSGVSSLALWAGSSARPARAPASRAAGRGLSVDLKAFDDIADPAEMRSTPANGQGE